MLPVRGIPVRNTAITTLERTNVKHQGHKGVRDMLVERTPRDKGLKATIDVQCYDNGKWIVNGDPCQDDLTAARVVAMCLEALGHARPNTEGRWLTSSTAPAASRS